MREHKWKLKWQMIISIVFLMVSIMLLIFFVFQNIRKIIVEQYSDAATQSVTAVANNINYILQDVENQTNSILLNREILDAIKEGNKNKSEELLNSYYISGLYIEGICIIREDVQWQIGAQISNNQNDERKNELANTSGEIIWLPTQPVQIQILSGEIDRNYFALGRKVVDIDTLKSYGYMVVELNEETLKESYKKLVDEKSEVVIVDNRNRIISREGDTLPLDYIEGEDKENIAGRFEFKKDGVDYVSIYAPFNRGEWRIVKTVPTQILYGEVDRLYTRLMSISAVVCIMFLGILYIYFQKITEPIAKMVGQMKEVEKGDLLVRANTNYINEFGQLGESFNHMVARIDTLVKEVITAERNKKEMELEMLHAQINPHFLYNTLSTIRFMAKFKGEDSISSAIVALNKLLRISINLGKEMISLDEEISYVENYLLIQRLRFNQKFEFESKTQERFGAILVPKLVLQPIVENALIYGVDEESDKILKISIFTEEYDKGVKVVVEDNGLGMDEEIIKRVFRDEKNINKFSTVGINNVNQRIKMYCGEEYGIEIDSVLGEGTKIIILLPKTYR